MKPSVTFTFNNGKPSFWGVYEFSWGTAVKYLPFDKWTTICIDGVEIDVSKRSVILHENGIEFVES